MSIETGRAEEILNELEERYKLPFIQESVKELKEKFGPMIEKEKRQKIHQTQGFKLSYGGFDPIKRISQAMDVFSLVTTFYQEAQINVDKSQRSIQDILHAIELLDLDDTQLLAFAKELQELRIIRRYGKDFIEMSEPLYQFAIKHKNIKKELTKVHSETVKTKEYMDNRYYKVREKTSLEEAFEEANKKI